MHCISLTNQYLLLIQTTCRLPSCSPQTQKIKVNCNFVKSLIQAFFTVHATALMISTYQFWKCIKVKCIYFYIFVCLFLRILHRHGETVYPQITYFPFLTKQEEEHELPTSTTSRPSWLYEEILGLQASLRCLAAPTSALPVLTELI